MVQEVHVGDIGTVFRITLYDGTNPVDVSGATSKSLWFGKPSGVGVQKPAAFYTDGTDGIIEYTIQAGDLDMPGTWKIQANVTLTAGTWSSDIQTFIVYENIA